MPIVEKCAKCGSSSVIQRAMVVDSYEGGKRNLQVRVDANPTAMMFKKSVHSPVHAWICGQCGYVELYADKPAELYKAFTEARSTMPNLG
jgi:predicted nucleic-acid-binding Zn-ribbon protein